MVFILLYRYIGIILTLKPYFVLASGTSGVVTNQSYEDSISSKDSIL